MPDKLDELLAEGRSVLATQADSGSRFVHNSVDSRMYHKWVLNCIGFLGAAAPEHVGKIKAVHLPNVALYHQAEQIFGILESAVEVIRSAEAIQAGSRSAETLGAHKTAHEATLAGPPGERKVFVVHGRNMAARDAIFTFLRTIKLEPIEWSYAIRLTGKPNPYVGEVLEAAFNHARAVLVLITPDETAALLTRFIKGDDPDQERKPSLQARPNVLFEAGMAMGRSPERTVFVQIGETRPFSDIGGRHVIRLTDSPKSRQDLADGLRRAGCAVDISDRDWQSIGEFDAAVAGLVPEPDAARRDDHRVRSHEGLDENDKKAIVEGWFRNRPAHKNTETIVFSEVDSELGLPPGTAKRYLKEIGSRLGHSVLHEGGSTILFDEMPMGPVGFAGSDGLC